jgi:tRNA-Thr(GGU) m(6)t(6)A37 methyltransferase TsaA
LRNALKTQASNNAAADDPHAMKMSTIGTIVSPYAKRMGTPRQGALVPSSRAFIQFASSLSPESVDGIDEYSHIWVVFGFHANTSLATSKKTKVRPPRGGGIKVGQLATRSPHRPNDLGLSLVKMERWEPSTRRLYISALDLINGTPVYDIKPYVHWDIPGDVVPSSLRLPSWVENKNDVLPKVEFAECAETSLAQFVKENRLAPLYANKDKTSLEAAKNTLKEILAQDPRSSHKGVSKNRRGSLSSESSYRLIFSGVEVEFVVEESGARVVGVHPAPVERQESSSS